MHDVVPLQSATFQDRRTHPGCMVFLDPLGVNDVISCSGIGHLCWWKSEEVGAVEKSILDEYGTIAHWNGTLGVRTFLGTGRSSNPMLML